MKKLINLQIIFAIIITLIVFIPRAGAQNEGDTGTNKVVPVFKNGEAQIVPGFAESEKWIRHDLWVETEFDSDDDGNLALSVPDLVIDGAEKTAVTVSVTGIDADASAEVTVSDGVTSVSGSLATDGDLVLDLTGLADGALTTSVTATDGDGATASVAGPALTLVPSNQ